MIDTLGMLEVAYALPEQCEEAAKAVLSLDQLPMASGISSVLVIGMGGSGIAGDVLAAVASKSSPVPVMVSKSHNCPEFVGSDTLVCAVSFSGDTDETVEAFRSAAERGARLVAITSGGELAKIADSAGATLVRLDSDIPMPRAAIASMSIPLFQIMGQLGLCEGVAAQIDSAVRQLSDRRGEFMVESNAAQLLARLIGRTLPLIYGGGGIGEAAARRWKSQVNENPKAPAFANTMPELGHNEISGWAQHGDVTRQVFSLILLRHAFEHPQVAKGLELVADICDEVVAGVHTVVARGSSELAQLFDLIYFGDLVSLHMALAEGVDPGPIPVIEELKERLRK